MQGLAQVAAWKFRMNVLRSWFSRRPVTAFYLLSLLVSWSYWLTMLPLATDSTRAPAVSHLPGLLGPMIAAIIVTAVVSGRSGLQCLVSSALRVPRPYVRTAILALSPVAIGAVTFLGLWAWGIPFPEWQTFSDYPGLPGGMPVAVVAVIILLLNGFGEEVGWRGFATTELLPRLGKFRATAVVAALWLVWHAPLFWLNTSMHALLGPILFGWAFGLICGAFVLAEVYLAGGQSILVVAVWHTLYNMVVATSAGVGTPSAVASTVVMLWGIFIAVRWWHQQHFER